MFLSKFQWRRERCGPDETKNINVIQDKLSESPLFIVAADVKGLYPNLKSDIVKRAVSRALEKHSKFSVDAREAILQLNNVCLSNVITQFESNFYIQDKGIVTGDNHLVTLANITAYYVLEPYSLVIEKAEIFRRFIDDIVWLSSFGCLSGHQEAWNSRSDRQAQWKLMVRWNS